VCGRPGLKLKLSACNGERSIVTESTPRTSRLLSPHALGALVVVLALLSWLWPIGIGGKMPVGGDVTQFFMGLMGVLGASLRAGRLPLWNDLWTYGFPGIGESQMGVFYPIHLLLYRWLDTERAYVASLVLHTLWGGLGTYWAARRLKISAGGSVLAAFSWSMGGFFLIHLAHQWSYTTGCWMPWAWGLTWCCLYSPGPLRRWAPFLLSLVIVLQLLPGHFQLAFMTQCSVLLILIWGTIEWVRGRGQDRVDAALARGTYTLTGALAATLAVAAAFPLAAIQLWPTWRLARLAASQRDPNYLSDFASTPFHLVNLVAPGLFHRSPLWRPLVWDPFHTSPEEHLAYVGLVPLFLAVMVLARQWRRDPVVRLLAILLTTALVLCLGPYVVGFRYLIMLPGFNFFRAPARWNLAVSLALSLLAGRGLDCWREWPQSGRSLRRFGFAALFWVAGTLGVIELALLSVSNQGSPALAQGFQRIFDAMPRPADFRAVMASARGPATDPRVPAYLNRTHFLQKNDDAGTFASNRTSIYAAELAELAALLVGLWLVARLIDRGRLGPGQARWCLVAVAFLDLWVLGRHRLLDVGPLAPLKDQSPVLARLAQEPRGTRIADDDTKNLPMLVGMAPLSAYRTLDLPALHELTWLTRGPLNEPLAQGALKATGTGVRVIDPIDNRRDRLFGRAAPARETIDDPALAGWLYGASWVRDQGPWARSFKIWRSERTAVRAWLVATSTIADPTELDVWSGRPTAVLAILDDATPLAADCPRPEEWSIPVSSEAPAWVIVSQLADPQWTARWIALDGQGDVAGDILPTFRKETEQGGWQRIAVPASGRWILRLEYVATDVAEGTMISMVAWLSWVIAAISVAVHARRGRFERTAAVQR
jgi:hypothetical protein